MALLTGMTPDGTEVPVQVDPSGRLVAEGLTGPQGAAGAPGSPAQLGGTADAPGLTPPGDPNTGIYSPGADQVAISTGGSGRLFVDSAGNVAIGRSPSSTFGVYASNLGLEMGYSSTLGGAYLQGYNRGAGPGSIDLIYYLDGSANHRFFTGGNERLRITSAGLVGVGVSAPSNKLTVRDTNETGLISSLAIENYVTGNPFSGNGVGIDFNLNNNGNAPGAMGRIAVVNTNYRAESEMRFYTGTGSAIQQRMVLDSQGRLAIGTTAARSLLHASGTISANDGVDIQSPDGSWWNVTVTDAGALTVARSTTTTSGVS